MDVHDFARRINEKLMSKKSERKNSIKDEDEWLSLWDEWGEFSKTMSEEDYIIFREECPYREMFCIIASGIEAERKKNA